MKIGYLGAGAWGFCLASLLASKDNNVISWTKNPDLAKQLNNNHEHPHLAGHRKHQKMHFTTDLEETLKDADLIVEAVTTAGLRPVFEQVKEIKIPDCPIVITSKGIEQDTGLILPEVAVEIFGEQHRQQIAFLSGPSYAQEVVKGLPTSVVGTAFDYQTMLAVCEAFTTKYYCDSLRDFRRSGTRLQFKSCFDDSWIA
jgi:glycerol-3-phosphate dehydrogenase (NAD(P)+)